MQFVKVRDENVSYTPPEGWDEAKDGKCGTLSVRRETGQGGRLYCYSNWKPDAADLAILNAGGLIELLCVGGQPPVALSVLESK